MNSIGEFRFSKNHCWFKEMENYTARLGLTEFYLKQFGTIEYLEFPERGDEIPEGLDLLFIESAARSARVIAPIKIAILKTNELVWETPSIINDDPWESGWLFEVEFFSRYDMDELLDSSQYNFYLDNYV